MIECSVCKEKIPNHAICVVEIYIPEEFRVKQYVCGFCVIPIRNALKSKDFTHSEGKK